MTSEQPTPLLIGECTLKQRVHSPIGARCPRIGGMEAKQLKAELMKEMEAEIDQLVESYKHSGPLTMTQLEDLLLAARQRMGQKLAERLIALQEQEVAAPIKQETGKVLRSKGKKKSQSRAG